VENNSPQEISVRSAQPEDAWQMHHVHVTSVRILCASDYTSEQIEAWVGFLDPEKRRHYMTQADHSEILFVAEDKLGTIVGFSSLGINEVNAVYVHPQYTRMGVGTLLLNAVETEAMAQNMKKLKLSASITAVPFYQARGYRVIEHSFHTLRSAVKIKSVSMEKSLESGRCRI
jgi:putative acetyltransferase